MSLSRAASFSGLVVTREKLGERAAELEATDPEEGEGLADQSTDSGYGGGDGAVPARAASLDAGRRRAPRHPHPLARFVRALVRLCARSGASLISTLKKPCVVLQNEGIM